MNATPASRPAHLPYGRWLGDFEALTVAELDLVKKCGEGEVCVRGGDPPKEATDLNTIRGELIRFLALGGDAAHPVHEIGVILMGAWIEGNLNLHGAQLPVQLTIVDSHFASVPSFTSATLPLLSLSGSTLPGLYALGMTVKGDVDLSFGFASTDEFRLRGSLVEGDNRGDVHLTGAQIGGNLYCREARFASADGNALSAAGMAVKGGIDIRGSTFTGGIDLTDAKVGSLIDDVSCWPKNCIFDGFTYERIDGPTSASDRIDWLTKQMPDHLKADFRPQPWEQLIKTLRQMGHSEEAKLVAIAKQRALRRARQIGIVPRRPDTRRLSESGQWVAWLVDAFGAHVAWLFHGLYGSMSGYGYRPFRVVLSLLLITGLFGLGYQLLDVGGGNCSTLPNNEKCRDDASLPWRYSADALLPLDFGLIEKDIPIAALGPSTEPELGYVRTMTWIETLLGWLLSGLLVAIASQLIKKD